jgi:peptide subunit release factor 1 (eRF1)
LLIIFSVNSKKDGISVYWNDEELSVKPYDGIRKQYFCGKNLLLFDTIKTLMYQIVLVDYEECYMAKVYSDGEIVKIFHDTSLVPHKMTTGGQSQHRYAQIRENEIVSWFKDINEIMKTIDGEVILGISSIYYSKFEKCLSTYNKQKIKERYTIEYNGLTGVYQMISRLNNKN